MPLTKATGLDDVDGDLQNREESITGAPIPTKTPKTMTLITIFISRDRGLKDADYNIMEKPDRSVAAAAGSPVGRAGKAEVIGIAVSEGGAAIGYLSCWGAKTEKG